MWTIKLLISKILYYFFPSRCYVCKKEGKTICDNCINKFPKNIDVQAFYIKSIFSFKYQEIKNIIHAIKYYHRKDLIKPLAWEMAKSLQNEIYKKQELNEFGSATDYKLKANSWTLVPIPMPTMRKYMRGYNQAELLAKEISEIISIPINNNLIIRVKNPKRQVKTKNKSERLKNQHNSFKIINDVSNLDIILVDDVTTTGATIDEARNILIKNGANKVIAITVAH